MKLQFLLIVALLGVVAHSARLPDLQLVEEDLPESVVAFQSGSGVSEVVHEDNDLDLGEYSRMICTEVVMCMQLPCRSH